MVVENIFENRYKYTQELVRMGAKITIEGRTAIIKGVRRLYGTNVKSTDLRGGAALVLAGIAAKGKTTIQNIEYVLRGYEDFNKKIKNLGINIKVKQLNGCNKGYTLTNFKGGNPIEVKGSKHGFILYGQWTR